MLSLFHAPQSRSSRVIWLLEELGADYDIAYTDIPRPGGSGRPDPNNPHPDKKVPALVHDGTLITESAAIFLYLTDLYPDAGMGPRVGDPLRGPYLTWLAYAGNVFEPVMHFEMLKIEDNPGLQRTFRGRAELHRRFSDALAKGDYLLGDRFSAADILYVSSAQWFRSALPEGRIFDDYLARCTERPALERANQKDSEPA